MTDPDFVAKLRWYKTAYSPMYEQYVAIVGYHMDPDGEPVVHAKLMDDTEVVFRAWELTEYVL